jgi:ketosteroid isomerase-like protein
VRRSILILITSLGFCAGSATATGNEPFAVVQHLFAAMSAQDVPRMHSTMTDDFHLLEVGEVWNRDKLSSVIAGLDPAMVRRNWFSPIRTEIRSDTAWVSYWNRATYHTSKGRTSRAWLESAILVRDSGQWKIQMLHSTRIEGDEIPEGVNMVEFRE